VDIAVALKTLDYLYYGSLCFLEGGQTQCA